jgi:hypothetical protein
MMNFAATKIKTRDRSFSDTLGIFAGAVLLQLLLPHNQPSSPPPQYAEFQPPWNVWIHTIACFAWELLMSETMAGGGG